MPSSQGPASAARTDPEPAAAAIRPPAMTSFLMPAIPPAVMIVRIAARRANGELGLELGPKLATNFARAIDSREGSENDLLLRNPGAGRAGHDRRHQDQCRPRQHLDLPQAARLLQAGRTHHGGRDRRQSRRQPVGAVDPDRGHRGPHHRRTRDADERADHVPGRPAHRPRHPPGASDRRSRAEIRGRQLRRVVPVRRPDQGLADAAVHGLHRRQFHRMHHRHALLADRRAQIRQAGARPRHALRRRTL